MIERGNNRRRGRDNDGKGERWRRDNGGRGITNDGRGITVEEG